MNTAFNRRIFLKRAALGTTALSVTRWFPGPNLLAVQDAGAKLNCVQIGCGGRGLSAHLDWLVKKSKDNVVAIVDVDEKRHAEVKGFLERNGLEASQVQTFTDYRVMFDKIGNSINAVFIATPNHHHAPAAMLAMQLGKAVYCEKPLCHDIAQARKLRQMARESKAPTQMGNQGHCETGYRRLCEFVWGGVVGNITETHSWTDRANGAAGPRPPSLPVPAGLHWDEWLGPAPFREYHAGLHPHDWHGWYDFGNGSLGNMGCHVQDGVFWALKVEHPVSVEAEEIRPGSSEAYPTGCRLRYDIPARGDMPPLKAYWYEGFKKDAQATAKGNLQSAKGKDQNLPSLFAELLQEIPGRSLRLRRGHFLCRRKRHPVHRHVRRHAYSAAREDERVLRGPQDLASPQEHHDRFSRRLSRRQKRNRGQLRVRRPTHRIRPSGQPRPIRRGRPQGPVGRPEHEGRQPAGT